MRERAGRPGGGKGPLVQEDVSGTLATSNDQAVFCMTGTQAHSGVDSSVCGTVTACSHKDPPTVAVAANQRGEVRLQQGDGTVSGTVTASRSGKQFDGLLDGPCVRRLTPRECERLQGMPDDWTKVPYRGKAAGECPDGPRYKAIGNSFAVPVVRWIGERMQRAMEEPVWASTE